MYSNKMKKRWPKSFKLLLRISEQYGTNIGKQNGKQFETGLHKTWYPGNRVTSQSRIWQPKWLTGPKAQPAILPGHPANMDGRAGGPANILKT